MFSATRRLAGICCPTNLCPELAPPGKSQLEGWAAPKSCSGPFNRKEEIELVIQDLRENLPGFDKYAEVLTVKTVGGGDWPAVRSWPGYMMPQATPVDNLYNVGDAVTPEGYLGAPGPAQSARIVMEEVKSRIKPGEA